MHNIDIDKEALVLGRYLVSATISETLINRYKLGLQHSAIQADKTTPLVATFIKHPMLLPFFDAGLALTLPNSFLRKRIFLMLAILEATPDYAHLFLEKKQGFLGFIKFMLFGFRAVYRAVIGIVLLKFYL